MAMKLDHIGIAQPSDEGLKKLFSDLGLSSFSDSEQIVKQQVAAAFSQLGEVGIELITPTSEESPIAKFLGNKGPGLHHLAFLVEDIKSESERLATLGYRPLTPEATLGARGKWVQFFHPKDTAGVLIELCQYKAGH
jgi:methylmalonyl-CoA/ethylmalonyl-CoA epimerase